jgi:non-homologous end joining protein Ku
LKALSAIGEIILAAKIHIVVIEVKRRSCCIVAISLSFPLTFEAVTNSFKLLGFSKVILEKCF